MLRYYTAGESHGKGLTIFLDGFPAGVVIDEGFINRQLARRQLGYGRGGRMKIETDTVSILNGVRFGKTTGAPITLWIENRDFKNWETIMAAGGERTPQADERSFVRPRPGHADLAGHYKYGHSDLRDVLERASARETAARVAAGAMARLLLKHFGVNVFSHVLTLGGIAVDSATLPDTYESIEARAEANDLRCAGPDALLDEIRSHIDATRKQGLTLGGRVEVVATGVPPGLGSYAQWDRKLDGQLAQAVMSIPAVKSVSIGAGDIADQVTGDQFHDEITLNASGHITRPTNRAGGLEGGVTNGMPVVVHAVMKPISTMLKALTSVNLQTGQEEEAHFERSDVTAVPACGVVAEAMVALVLARAFLEKFGGDSLAEIERHVAGSRELIGQ